METIEKKVVDAILQRPSDILEINGREYPISAPTPATLILVSELISEIPDLNTKTDNLLIEVLSSAKDLSVIGDICATLILGAKRIKERKMVEVVRYSEHKKWSWRKFRFSSEYKENVLEVKYLSELILENVSNETLKNIFMKRLGMMNVGDFFAITTSLNAANQLRRTKEVVQTAFGDK